MELQVGKYTLKSDKYCVFIEEEYKVKEGNNKGKTLTRRVTCFYRDFGALLDDFIDSRVKDSDASNLKQVIAEIDSASKEAKRIAREAVKADFHIVRDTRKG